ncbi:MAG: serine protease [Bacteroidetes bacterium]|nr:serine protease [Bacteroidota bacterium]
MKTYWWFFLGLSLGCSQTGPDTGPGRTDPLPGLAGDLTEDQSGKMTEPVILISSVAYYHSFHFPEDRRITLSDIHRRSPEAYAISEKISNVPQTGSGIVLESSPSLMLLTCRHILIQPDTLFQFYSAKNPDGQPYLRVLSLKFKTTFTLPEFSHLGDLILINSESETDLALAGIRNVIPDSRKPDVFAGKINQVGGLIFGTTAYHVGYPGGNKQITRGLTSPAGKTGSSFLTDAVVNKGYSGGPVFGLDRQTGEPVLLGIIRAVPIHTEWVAAPYEEFSDSAESVEFSSGRLLIRRQTFPHYGTTHISSSEAVLRFLSRSESVLKEKGFRIPISAPPL